MIYLPPDVFSTLSPIICGNYTTMPLATTSYTEIFEARGTQHAEAFRLYPDAIADEVSALLDLANIRPHQTVLDMPSASGFLSAHLKTPDVQLIAVDPSPVMHRLCKQVVPESYCVALTDLPIPSESIDVVICLAGLHHEENLNGVFEEVCRILRRSPRGSFVIGEVDTGSAPAIFLNEFVNQHSSTGHVGHFFDGSYLSHLHKAGFSVTTNQYAEYWWQFASEKSMAHFLSLMLGIDKASDQEITSAARKILGIDSFADGGIGLRWGLRHVVCKKF